jgi:hypothetical protein
LSPTNPCNAGRRGPSTRWWSAYRVKPSRGPMISLSKSTERPHGTTRHAHAHDTVQ